MQRMKNVLSVFRLLRIGQAYGDDNKPLQVSKGHAAKRFHQSRQAARIKTAQIDNDVFIGKGRGIFIVCRRNAGLLRKFLCVAPCAAVSAAVKNYRFRTKLFLIYTGCCRMRLRCTRSRIL